MIFHFILNTEIFLSKTSSTKTTQYSIKNALDNLFKTNVPTTYFKNILSHLHLIKLYKCSHKLTVEKNKNYQVEIIFDCPNTHFDEGALDHDEFVQELKDVLAHYNSRGGLIFGIKNDPKRYYAYFKISRRSPFYKEKKAIFS
jgi:hypothetical protein